MKSIDFPGAFMKIGDGQPQYDVIHAMPLVDSKEGEVIAMYELTDEEVQQVIRDKRIYYSRLTFGQKFQPMRLSVSPVPIKATLIFDADNPPVTIDAAIGPDGVVIPGYTKTAEGKYIKD